MGFDGTFAGKGIATRGENDNVDPEAEPFSEVQVFYRSIELSISNDIFIHAIAIE